MSIKIFFCYAHEDEDLLRKLKIQLSPLLRQGLIDVWHDRDIGAGIDWEQEIKEHLNAAQLILLLVSPDFIASDYCYGSELKRALERHDRKEARVIPIILRPVYWQGVLGKLQALPKDARAVTDPAWHNLDRALYNVTEGIRTVVEQLSAQPPVKPAGLSAQTGEEQHVPFSAPSAETPAPRSAVELTTLVVAVPKPAAKRTRTSGSKPVKAPVSERTPSSVDVPKQAPAPPLPAVKPEAFSELRTLTGHTGSVKSLVFSPDGQTLTSLSADTTIKVWNPWTGAEVRSLTEYFGFPRSVAFSPDGQLLAGGGSDMMITVWNSWTGAEVRSLTGQSSSITGVAFSPAGQLLASGS